MEVPADDAALVALAADGDPRAFGAIVARYKDAIFAIALSRVRDYDDADDVTQTTLVEAYGRLGRLKEPEGLGPWLRTIAINRSINLLRRRERNVGFEVAPEPATERPSSQEEIEQAELRQQVMAAVGRLSQAQRETVTLHYLGEHSLAVVAAIQAVPVGTVKRRLHDARKRLRRDMFEMVEEVLRDSAPDEAMAERVFGLLCAYPSGGRLFSQETTQTLARIGLTGREGFARVLDLPHWRSRLMAVHYLGQRYVQGGPPADLALGLLLRTLEDGNRGMRHSCWRSIWSTSADGDARVRRSALERLASHRSPPAPCVHPAT